MANHWTVEYQETLTPGYAKYHQSVVEACVELMGEHTRDFWQFQCSYEEEFKKGTDPRDVADDQRDAL